MKKSITLIFAVLAIAVLAVSFSGCLSAGDDASPAINSPNAIDNPAMILSVHPTFPFGNNNEVTASILVQIQGTLSQSVDRDNITVTIVNDRIYVNLPVVDSSDRNTRDFGHETVDVLLGTRDQFENKIYTIVVNVGTDREFTSTIGFGNGFNIRSGDIGGVVIGTDGNNITINAYVTLGGSAETIDRNNITTSGGFVNGKYVIDIPTQTRTSGITTSILLHEPVSFVVGQLDQLANGTYTVSVNGNEVTFTIENGAIVEKNDFAVFSIF